MDVRHEPPYNANMSKNTNETSFFPGNSITEIKALKYLTGKVVKNRQVRYLDNGSIVTVH